MAPVVIFAFITFFSTFLGGLFVIKFKNKIHLIMAASAGVILGVVGFDIFPEIINQVKTYNFNPTKIMAAFVAGFLFFHILEKTILIHSAHEADYADHKHPRVGALSALALIGHSFMDGLGIGFGFQISSAAGALVALAVIAHDFTDGANTVSLSLVHKNSLKRAKLFLLFDSLAPVLGAAATLFFKISPRFLVFYLAVFAGFLLYIGASDILPEAHSRRSSFSLIALTVSGAVFVFILTRLIV